MVHHGNSLLPGYEPGACEDAACPQVRDGEEGIHRLVIQGVDGAMEAVPFNHHCRYNIRLTAPPF